MPHNNDHFTCKTASVQDFVKLFSEAEAQYYELRSADPRGAEKIAGEMSRALKERFPALYSGKRIAFYGTGRISSCILSVIERFAKDLTSELLFIHTRNKTGDRFRGYPVYNVADIQKAAPDLIVIASVIYKDEIHSELKQNNCTSVPIVSVPENISLLLDNYDRWSGRVMPSPAIVNDPQDSFRKMAKPFYADQTDWQSREMIEAFPAIREKIIAVIDPAFPESSVCGIPVLKSLPKSPDDVPVRKTEDVLTEYLEYHERVEYCPTAMRLDVSTVCQLNCPGCYMRKEDYGTMGRGYIRAAQVQKLLDGQPSIRKMELSNSGEPFCNPEMYEILRLLHERNILIQFWNGANFNDVPDRVLDALVRFGTEAITISLDGVTQEVYSKYRRNGNIDKVFSNIRKINDLKKKYHTDRPLLRWQFILMNHNQHEAAAAKKMAAELGMIMFFKPDWSGGFVPDSSLGLNEITGLSAMDETEYYIKENHIFDSNAICSQMILSPQVNWDGKLLGCCNVYKNDWNINVFETPLSEIFNNANYRAAVLSLLKGRDGMDHTGPCRECYIYRKNVINGLYPLSPHF